MMLPNWPSPKPYVPSGAGEFFKGVAVATLLFGSGVFIVLLQDYRIPRPVVIPPPAEPKLVTPFIPAKPSPFLAKCCYCGNVFRVAPPDNGQVAIGELAGSSK